MGVTSIARGVRGMGNRACLYTMYAFRPDLNDLLRMCCNKFNKNSIQKSIVLDISAGFCSIIVHASACHYAGGCADYAGCISVETFWRGNEVLE